MAQADVRRYTLARIIGNELPPRDAPRNRVRSLEYVLKNEPKFADSNRIWILNQIHDVSLRNEIKNILNRESMYELNFDPSAYRRAKTMDEKIVAAININKARNLAIDLSDGYFTFVMDGDSLFNEKLWERTVSEIECDQLENPERKYYGILAVRIIGEMPEDISGLKRHEATVVVRKDATLRFDETIPFSKCEKIELLRRLGYVNEAAEPEGDLCKNVGDLFHISFNDEKSERDLHTRMELRRRSINILLKQLDCIKMP